MDTQIQMHLVLDSTVGECNHDGPFRKQILQVACESLYGWTLYHHACLAAL